MRTANLLAALAVAAGPALASEWHDIKDPQALKGLYSNKTFKGKDWMGRPFVGHYRPDGKGILLFEGHRHPRSWSVKDDQVCIATQVNTQCYRFQGHAARAGLYRSINVANDMATELTVEDGVPNF